MNSTPSTPTLVHAYSTEVASGDWRPLIHLFRADPPYRYSACAAWCKVPLLSHIMTAMRVDSSLSQEQSRLDWREKVVSTPEGQ